MCDILEAINKSIIPDKKTLKRFNVKNKNLIKHRHRDNSTITSYVVSDLYYAGTLLCSMTKQTIFYDIESQRDLHFLRIIIDDGIHLVFNGLHIYGNLLNHIYANTSNYCEAGWETQLIYSVDEAFGPYDYNDPRSIECAAEKILQILRVVREINLVTRRHGDFTGVDSIIKARFNIC